ncbi:MAG: hypothetical protein QOD66_3214, partial [Solirubrobacteraceae bacterium]|nr:hypothetical protein [Solirubrobacteraceae bacterium]
MSLTSIPSAPVAHAASPELFHRWRTYGDRAA